MPPQPAARIERLRASLRAEGARAILVTHLPNIFYLSGFTGENAMLLLGRRAATLFTDPRFDLQARQECSARGVSIEIARGPLAPAAGEYLRHRRGTGTVLYEEERLTVAQFRHLRHAARGCCAWRGARGTVEALREVKDRRELDRMRDAARLADRVMTSAISAVRPGITELQLAAKIEHRMRELGATGPSFETIVASGARSALPHGRPTSKRLKKGELVVLDLGVILCGYCSDITRTVHVGPASARVRRWYRAVERAQLAARQAVCAGVAASAVDAEARQVLRGERLEQYFIHSTGHGLGIEVHERPALARNQAARLKAGSVVTIEPGVYVPGRGGIRIEDDVLVKEDGGETLTHVSRKLLEI